jgi:hypothetical protein
MSIEFINIYLSTCNHQLLFVYMMLSLTFLNFVQHLLNIILLRENVYGLIYLQFSFTFGGMNNCPTDRQSQCNLNESKLHTYH